jgi:hypothetical protein
LKRALLLLFRTEKGLKGLETIGDLIMALVEFGNEIVHPKYSRPIMKGLSSNLGGPFNNTCA